MSNLLQPMPVIQCKESLLDFVQPKYCAKLPTNLKSFQLNQTQNFSSSAVSAKLEISNTAQVIDRNLIYQQPLDFVIKGTVPDPNVFLNGVGRWGFRSNALAKIINTINIQYGNSSYSFSSSDVISMLEHYNDPEPGKYTEDFQQVMLDASQQYDDLEASRRNPLNSMSAGTDSQYARGSQPIWGAGGNKYTGTGVYSVTSSVTNPGSVPPSYNSELRFSTTLEALILSSPLLDKLCVGGGAYGLSHLNNININMTFVGNLGNRLLSFFKNAGSAGEIRISDITVVVQRPNFRFEQISDKEPIPRLLSYGLNTIERYPFEVAPQIAPGIVNVSSQVIQLSRIPSWMMFGVRPSNSTYDSKSFVGNDSEFYSGCQIPDCFMPVRDFIVNFDGQTLFSNTDPTSIYKMCKENKIVDNYINWAGYSCVTGTGSVPTPGGLPSNTQTYKQYNGIGSVVKLAFGRDISLLKENLATGVNYRTNLQVIANFQNVNKVVSNWSFYVVLCYDDVIQIFDDNNANICSAPLTQNDVLSASPDGRMHYDALRDHNLTGGRGKLSGLSHLVSHGHKKHHTIRDMMMQHGNKAEEAVKSMVGSGGSIATRAGMKKSMVMRD